MRRAALAVMGLVLLVPGPAIGQSGPLADRMAENIYQAGWCWYLHARPYMATVPADVVCDYDPRPMAEAEAGAYYLRAVRPSNLVNSRWGCAVERSQGGLAWKQVRKWSTRASQGVKLWSRDVRRVTWPTSVAKKVDRLLDSLAVEMLHGKRATSHKTYLEAVVSGDWARYMKTSTKSSDLAQQVRLALRIPPVPVGGSDCKQAKRLERLLKE